MHAYIILVDDLSQAKAITDLLTEAEMEGEITFPFTARVSESLSEAQAKDVMYRDNALRAGK